MQSNKILMVKAEDEGLVDSLEILAADKTAYYGNWFSGIIKACRPLISLCSV